MPEQELEVVEVNFGRKSVYKASSVRIIGPWKWVVCRTCGAFNTPHQPASPCNNCWKCDGKLRKVNA